MSPPRQGSLQNVRVLDVDPDLGYGVAPDRWPAASRSAVAALLNLPRTGPWPISDTAADRRGEDGLLIVDGLVARIVSIGARGGLELLGPGDVLKPWVESDHDFAVVSWSIIEPARIAWLDRDFAARVAPWPEIAAAINNRMLRRARGLAFLHAVSHLVTVEERLLMTLWHFAERWGRVTPRGVVVHLPLTHELLASLVGARRPPVTTALGCLTAKGLVSRGENGSWTLAGPPPATVAELHEALAS